MANTLVGIDKKIRDKAKLHVIISKKYKDMTELINVSVEHQILRDEADDLIEIQKAREAVDACLKKSDDRRKIIESMIEKNKE